MKNRGWISVPVVIVLVISAAIFVAYLNPTYMQAGQPATGGEHAVFVPAVAEWHLVSNSPAPPSESDCFAMGLRCFTPQSMTAAYNYGPLFDQGFNGKGKTIAVIDSFGSPTIASDLHVFDTAFGVQPMCGEAEVTCTSDMPTFRILQVQGSPAPLPQPPNHGTGARESFRLGSRGLARCGVGARHRTPGKHSAGYRPHRRNPRCARLPAHDESGAVRGG